MNRRSFLNLAGITLAETALPARDEEPHGEERRALEAIRERRAF